METKLYSLRDGLKKARKRRGWTQEDLRIEMGVSLKTVMNWEQGRVNPPLETMIELCEVLDCDLDYLIGRLEEKTHDLHSVHEFTGLSEKALDKIICPELNHPMSKTLSHLIESDKFENLITSYKVFLELLKQLDDSDLEQLSSFELKEGGNVVLSTNEAINHFKQQVSLVMEHICDSDHMTRLSQLEMKKEINDKESLMREISSTRNEIAYLKEHLQFLEEEMLPVFQDKGKE